MVVEPLALKTRGFRLILGFYTEVLLHMTVISIECEVKQNQLFKLSCHEIDGSK